MHCYTYVKRTVLKKCLNCFISLQHGDTGILLLFSSRCSSSSSLSAGLNLKCCFYDNNPLRPAPGTETTEKDVFHIHPSSALSISAGAEASPSCYGPRQVTSLSQGNTTIPAHFYNDSQESLINLSLFLLTCDSLCSLHSSYVSARNKPVSPLGKHIRKPTCHQLCLPQPETTSHWTLKKRKSLNLVFLKASILVQIIQLIISHIS